MSTKIVLRMAIGWLLLPALWMLNGCHALKTSPRTTPTGAGMAVREASAALPAFEEVAQSAGLKYQWTIAGKRPLTILQTIGNGCAFLDYDNDGNLDILLVGPQLALYRGDGHGHFTDVTHESGLDRLVGHFLGCAVGDYDNDGYPDIYLSAYRGGALLHNEARGAQGRAFRDVTKEAGIAAQPWGTSCTFADLEGEGRLDLYIGNYVQFASDIRPQLCDFHGILGSCGPRYYKPEYGVLYHNVGNGRFVDTTRAQGYGKSAVAGKALGVAAADYDNSGHQSLAIANDEMRGDLLRPQSKIVKNMALEAGVAFSSDGSAHGGMGIDWGDYDNDGKLDLFVATYAQEAKCLYHNLGNGFFQEESSRVGIAEKTTRYVAFGAKFLDYDNDGFLDLIIANGHVEDNVAEIDHSARYRQPIQLFHNLNGTRFVEAGPEAGPAFQQPIVGRGLAIGDYDNDGRMDALVVDSEGKPLLLHNVAPAAGHWLECRLEGKKSNRDGIGALLTIETQGQKRLRLCHTDGSYLSASDKRVHFGLGSALSADITIRWPSGVITTHKNMQADQIVTLKEVSSTSSK